MKKRAEFIKSLLKYVLFPLGLTGVLLTPPSLNLNNVHTQIELVSKVESADSEEVKLAPGLYKTGESEYFIYGRISSELVKYAELLYELGTAQPGKTIYVHLDSLGGNLLVGMTLDWAIRSSKARVYTVVHTAASAAALIATAGTDMLVADDSIMMFHQAWYLGKLESRTVPIKISADESVYQFFALSLNNQLRSLHFSESDVEHILASILHGGQDIFFTGRQICEMSRRSIAKVGGCYISMR